MDLILDFLLFRFFSVFEYIFECAKVKSFRILHKLLYYFAFYSLYKILIIYIRDFIQGYQKIFFIFHTNIDLNMLEGK